MARAASSSSLAPKRAETSRPEGKTWALMLFRRSRARKRRRREVCWREGGREGGREEGGEDGKGL